MTLAQPITTQNPAPTATPAVPALPQTTNYTSEVTNNEGGGQTTVYTPVNFTSGQPTSTPTPAGSSVSASALGATTPTYPTPQPINTANNRLGATVGAQANMAQGTQAAQGAPGTTQPTPNGTQPATQPTTQPTPAQADRQSTLKQILGIFQQQQNKGADTLAAQKEQDVAGKQQQVTDLTNKLASTRLAYQQQADNIRKNLSGAGSGYVDSQLQDLERVANQDLANISIQLNAAQGNYKTAFDIAKQTVDAKYEPLKEELSTLQTYYTLSQNDMTESEKQQAQEKIDEKKMALQNGYSKDLAQYEQQLKEADPLHAAQVAEAWANAHKANAAGAGGKLTQAQATALGYAQRALAANNVVNALGSKFTGVESYAGQVAPNFLKSSDRQSYEQAQRQFVNAVLRQESGAAISPSEFASAQKEYFPQPGDNSELIAQKAAARQLKIQGLSQQASASSEAGTGDTVNISGQDVPVGSVIENAQGQRGTVNADGSITPL